MEIWKSWSGLWNRWVDIHCPKTNSSTLQNGGLAFVLGNSYFSGAMLVFSGGYV